MSARLEVARVGRVEETDDRVMPFRLLDERGVEIAAVTEFLHHMLACCPPLCVQTVAPLKVRTSGM